jgi:hypothetical protein
MKMGCIGCLLFIVGIIFLAAVAGGFLFLSGNIFEAPPFDAIEWSRGDASSAQSKLVELVRRDAGQSSRQDPVFLSEREANALAAQYLAQTAHLRFEPFGIRLSQGQFSLRGRTELGSLLQGPPFAQLRPYIPPGQLARPMWISARGYIALDQGVPGRRPGTARVVVSEFSLGKQPVGTWPVSIVMGPASTKLFHWPVPGTVRDVQIEDRRVVIRTR